MNLSRRTWMAASAAATVTVLAQAESPIAQGASAADPVKRPGAPLLKLSLAGYSFNGMLVKRGTPDEIMKAEMSLEKFIDYCAAQGLGATELTGYYFPKTITTEYLLSLRAQTHRLGLSISGTAIGNDFCLAEGDARQKQLAECREWIDYAAIMGAPTIRIFAGCPVYLEDPLSLSAICCYKGHLFGFGKSRRDHCHAKTDVQDHRQN